MRDVGIVSTSTPDVRHPEGSSFVYLTFRGLREVRSSVDRDTRVRIALPIARAMELLQQLSAVVPGAS